MTENLLPSSAALACLLPAAVYILPGGRPGRVIWPAVALAVLGPAVWTAAQIGESWRSAFPVTLWLIISCSIALYAALARLTKHGWRLGGLLLPYLAGLAGLAIIWGGVSGRPLVTGPVSLWFQLHIAFALAAFAALTLSAVSGLAVFLRERALARKARPAFLETLPSVADAEGLELRLLALAEGLLGVAVLCGMGAQYAATGAIFEWGHKTLLTLLAFAAIAGLLALRSRGSLGGRRAARGVLLAYLLLALAYPGVKFVNDVLMV